ncbi:MAG TPA: MaoC family dehydratase [Candidatus Sulfotelmatobacter sp.]|nr:MaoC family dehydratase [Candidatus Sulfotelmatobacter sp.]
MRIGEAASQSFTVTEQVIRQFADLVGDHNPMHLDEAFAARTRFGTRIAHGMIAAGLISAVVGNQLPGPGTIYLSQSLQFTAPVFPGDVVTATAKVTNLRDDKPIATLETVCTKQSGEVVLRGEAVVVFPQSRM